MIAIAANCITNFITNLITISAFLAVLLVPLAVLSTSSLSATFSVKPLNIHNRSAARLSIGFYCKLQAVCNISLSAWQAESGHRKSIESKAPLLIQKIGNIDRYQRLFTFIQIKQEQQSNKFISSPFVYPERRKFYRYY